MIEVWETKYLFYYDYPLMLEAIDKEGNRYILDWFDETESGISYAGIPVTDEQVSLLNSGAKDFRTAFIESSTPVWYRSAHQWDFSKPIVLLEAEGNIEDFLNLPENFDILKGAWGD